MKHIIPIFIAILLSACSAKPQKYYYDCREQQKEIWSKAISSLTFQMGYAVENLDSINNTIVAKKLLQNTGTTSGLFLEFLQLHISYKSDSLSEITPYYVTEQNANRKVYALSKEQQKIYEPEILQFIERMKYYCNPRFK